MTYPPHFSTIPKTIDSTGKRDVTLELREFMQELPLRPTTDKETGTEIDRRQGRLRPVPSPRAGFADGFYRLEGGAWGPTDLDLDLDGAKLYPTARDTPIPGTPDQPWKRWAGPLWPRQRATLHLEARSRVFSRRNGARIHGCNFEPAWLGGFRPPDKRAWAIGTAYLGQKYEGQHAVAVHDDGCIVDTRKIELAFTYGDGVSPAGHAHTTILLGTPSPADVIDERRAATIVSDGAGWRWKPADVAVHGIHHTGRQGVSQAGGSDLVMRGLTMFQVHRSWLDMEPGAGGTMAGALVEDCVVGTFQNLWIAAGGNGFVNDVTIRRNRSIHRPLSIVARREKAGTGRRRNWSVTDNAADDKARSGSTLAVMRFDSYDGVEVARNHQRARTLGAAGLETANCTGVDAPDLEHQFVA